MIKLQTKWHNYNENFSNALHTHLPPFLPKEKGYNYYASFALERWNKAVLSDDFEQSFQSNDTSFMVPVQKEDLMLFTGSVL